ncbi:unnamed protein product [Nezara viridula]|uniref:Guanylate cyclase n=1 Tax=Nezara viridula TaxID=85310 RepID=A0A9P0HLA2_NEZVI|nr:unnamed protein product [Nezara viridula]
METILLNRTSALIGSFPPEICQTTERLATIVSMPLVVWDCPTIVSEFSDNVHRVQPKMATVISAIVNVVKHLRYRSASIVSLRWGAWGYLSLALENSLLRSNVSVKQHITLFGPPPDSIQIQSKVAVILVPLSWRHSKQLMNALAANSKALLFFHPHLHLSLKSYVLPLSKAFGFVMAVYPIKADSLDGILNSSFQVLEDTTESSQNNLRSQVEGFMLWALDGNSSSVRWRQVFYQHVVRHDKQETLYSKTLVNGWATPLLPPNRTENCEEVECEEPTGFFTNTINIILVSGVAVLLTGIFATSISILRRLYIKSRMSKGPCKIILTPNDFIFPQVQEAKRVEEGIEAMLCCWLYQLQEMGGPEVDKQDLIKGSVGSLKSNMKKSPSLGSISKVSSDPKARYNGDLVQLKPIPDTSGNFELKSKSMDYLMAMHSLRHENLNPMLGCLCDPAHPYLVWEYCSRGSLEDVLMADEIKLDWSFRLSLLTDLVRGMKYLHSSPIKVHGNLTSRNCVIDARWVLKITDYGLPFLYEGQNIVPPNKKPKDLLWSAPEFLRDSSLRKMGTQAGDVYSFGIVMQEVVVRGEPYCMLSLPADEILEKIRKPPPLIRPSVSKGAAPPEAINIMRQCWAEAPEMRPDFNTIHDLFKTLNHGRKANFVDTMFQMLEKYSNNLEDLIRERTEQLDMEKKKTEQLLNRMLPSYVADKLKLGMPVDPEEFSEVTIYFSDIVGFTTISAYSTPFEVVDLLNDLYTCFDATINAYNVYKVETIGDAYMVVGGLPIRTPDHAQQIATMALDLLHQSGKFRIRHLPFTPLRLRIGLHTGPCCAGVVGLTMPRYCLFGDTVNTASRMESSGSAWRIHISDATKNKLEESGGYHIECRGQTELKGKGKVMTYWLLGKVGFDKQLPTPPPIRLDEQLVLTGRTGIVAEKPESEEDISMDLPKDITNQISKPHGLARPKPVYQLSLDAGLLAASGEEKKESHRWRAQRQMTFDANDDTKSEQKKMSDLKSIESGSSRSSLLTPFSVSEISVDRGVSFIKPSRSTQNLSPKLKKIIDENDLSSQYNQYKCLSPNDSTHSMKSLRFLKRQFSMDKEEASESKAVRLFKQNSAGAANDLGRIDEVPLSTVSSPQFSRNSNYKHRTIPANLSSESLN